MSNDNQPFSNRIDPEELMTLAKEAQQRAYAPYSDYPVGAALLTASGRVFTGCNVENASFGLTVCAERVAVFKAVSEGEHEFEALAVISKSHRGNGPCGACRQVLREFGQDLRIILREGDDQIRVLTLTELLPRSFGPESLAEARG